MRNRDVHLTIENEDGIEREVTITQYTYHRGYKGHGPNSHCPGCPPESDFVEDIIASWNDSEREFSENEYDRYYELLEDACLENARGT